ncbi:aminopeptidase P family protein [Lapillicoccus jejuensis]|uniref:aminopeptidase P family protein n=1 Tax=Lapillicoccus jejuensis TaxID=402171 RepID=UPI0011531C77|nr:aminopeptidase P family protein [Lapillicoccus jejuensis]
MSEQQQKSENRERKTTDALREFISRGWTPRPEGTPDRAPVADFAAERRARLGEEFAGERLVVPAGGFKVRTNDTDYRFRPHTAFAWLTGFGGDQEPDAVLVLEPLEGGGHEAVLYFRPYGGREGDEFFSDARYGEFWVGARPTLADVEAEYGLTARHIDELADALAKDAGTVVVRVVRDADADVAALVDKVRQEASEENTSQEEESREVDLDHELAARLSTLRLVKDAFEVEEMRKAVDATQLGFDEVVARLREALEKERGERWVEGLFALHARHEGNGVGYDSICASGDHASTLHWIKNTGAVEPGVLLLLDAGVEVDSLYTADITRTLPVDGTFTEAQRKVYDAVLEAQEAAMAVIKPGVPFSAIHDAAIRVIAETVHEWGLLPEGVTLEQTLDKEEGQFHRRWMVHGTSHHLGLDVHDCALATRADYMEADLRPGMILTVEPGLYFKADDELVPEELRGIGVRIEDDVLVTEDGYELLSSRIPRTADDVEAWIASRQG